jgi:hypothetical protein
LRSAMLSRQRFATVYTVTKCWRRSQRDDRYVVGSDFFQCSVWVQDSHFLSLFRFWVALQSFWRDTH